VIRDIFYVLDEFFRFDRFRQIDVRTGCFCLFDISLTLESADDDNGGLHRFLIASDPPQHLKSVHIGHNQIDNKSGRGSLPVSSASLPAVRSNYHVVSGKNDIVLQNCSREMLIVDNENFLTLFNSHTVYGI